MLTVYWFVCVGRDEWFFLFCVAADWNSGNIGRTCLGLGARLHLVGPLGFSLDDRHVRRAGLDYWHHVDLRVYDDWAAFSSKGGPMHAIGGTRYFFTKFGAEPGKPPSRISFRDHLPEATVQAHALPPTKKLTDLLSMHLQLFAFPSHLYPIRAPQPPTSTTRPHSPPPLRLPRC